MVGLYHPQTHFDSFYFLDSWGILFLACFGPKLSLIHLFPRLPRECGWPNLALSCCHFYILVCNASACFRFLHCFCSHCRPSLDVFCNVAGKINTLGLSSLIHLAKSFLQPFTPLSFPALLHVKKYKQTFALEGMLTEGSAAGNTPRKGPKEGEGGKELPHTAPIKGDFIFWHSEVLYLATEPASLLSLRRSRAPRL